MVEPTPSLAEAIATAIADRYPMNDCTCLDEHDVTSCEQCNYHDGLVVEAQTVLATRRFIEVPELTELHCKQLHSLIREARNRTQLFLAGIFEAILATEEKEGTVG